MSLLDSIFRPSSGYDAPDECVCEHAWSEWGPWKIQSEGMHLEGREITIAGVRTRRCSECGEHESEREVAGNIIVNMGETGGVDSTEWTPPMEK